MQQLPKNSDGCPYLILAPMEGVGDRCFRKAMASVGGFDEAVTEFLRVPTNAHVKSLARQYHSNELISHSKVPLAAQIMGSDPELMGAMASELEGRGAPRIDLNCGCPSNKVTGRGAGSSLLKDPAHLHEVAKSIVSAVSVPVTVKMRSGYEDTSLFLENLLAAQESGISYLTLHPRTKVEGYGPPARWDLIAKAKSVLKIPVVGNGDILSLENALAMLKETACDALMIGRGSVTNPFLFHQIKAHFAEKSYIPQWEQVLSYLHTYISEISLETSFKMKINKMKQLMGFLFKGNSVLYEKRQTLLTSNYSNFEDFMGFSLELLKEGWDISKKKTGDDNSPVLKSIA